MSATIPNSLQAVLVTRFPELRGAQFTLLTQGWDSVAIDVDDRLIFKFPRHAAAEAALRREASLLAVIRPAVTLPVPDLTLEPGPPLFSRHAKLKGEHLVTAGYEALPDVARYHLAAEMAQFYAELHVLDKRVMEAARAMAIQQWLPPEEIFQKAWPVLPAELHFRAEQAIAAWQQLPPDPYGVTYGFFDGHGWNMAFDHEQQKLNGIYDFADSGFGPLHQEFIYSNFISPDLTARIITAYEWLTQRSLDRERIHLLTGVHRLSELAELADDPEYRPLMLKGVAEWMAG